MIIIIANCACMLTYIPVAMADWAPEHSIVLSGCSPPRTALISLATVLGSLLSTRTVQVAPSFFASSSLSELISVARNYKAVIKDTNTLSTKRQTDVRNTSTEGVMRSLGLCVTTIELTAAWLPPFYHSNQTSTIAYQWPQSSMHRKQLQPTRTRDQLGLQ